MNIQPITYFFAKYLVTHFLYVIFFICLISAPTTLRADALLNETKARFIYNLTHYTTWPDVIDKPHICIYNKNSITQALQKELYSKKITVSNAYTDSSLNSCNILFIGKCGPKPIAKLLNQIESLPLLTISDCKQFVELGGAVQFINQKSNVRLIISPKSLSDKKIVISSNLLEIAQIHE